MSRFVEGDGEGLPWEMWQNTLSRALGGARGQKALAEMEGALVALPEPKLIEGHLATDGQVCAIGALVAARKAADEGIDIAAAIAAMSAKTVCWCGHSTDAHAAAGCTEQRVWGEGPCSCKEYDPDPEDPTDTAMEGERLGMAFAVAWHMAYLNDEEFAGCSPEQRYERMLAWVRRAQGKVAV